MHTPQPTKHSTYPGNEGQEVPMVLCEDRLVSGVKGRAKTRLGHGEKFENLTQGDCKCQVLEHLIML